MYIRKQPSGGRGEYEVSGDYSSGANSLQASDLLDRHLFYEFGSYGYHATANAVRLRDGKKRIRLDNPNLDIHGARQITAALLLPKSRREEIGLGGGRPTIMRERYILRQIHFDQVELRGATEAYIRVGNLDLDNGSQVDTIAFQPRMGLVEHLHQNARSFPDAIRQPLEQHQRLLQAANVPLDESAENLVDRLMEHVAENAPDYNVEYTRGGDVVPVLAEMISTPPMEVPVDIESIPPDDLNIRLREVAKWRRWVAARGPTSARFRRAVREAYDSSCLVCGIRLPLSEFCRVPGVDSAHILPWATHDMDIVPNGLCLCRMHHWAFDQQLIAIVHEDGKYLVRVTDRARSALDAAAVAQLEAFAGEIARARLPSNTQHWPRPQLLGELYRLVGG
jgi:putative restriction endonuclease